MEEQVQVKKNLSKTLMFPFIFHMLMYDNGIVGLYNDGYLKM